MKKVWYIGSALLLVLVTGVAILLIPRVSAPVSITPGAPVPEPAGTACTMDALLCPDGSYVGRTGPNCEFVCPIVATTTADTVVTPAHE